MNQTAMLDAVVAGHICLDLFPTFVETTALRQFSPGALYKVGPALRSTGGAVANTGLALHRLGLKTALMGKVGDDLFGDEIMRLLRGHDEKLTRGMKLSRGEASSYTVVISPPGIDRTFLHCSGCNDTFTSADLNEAVLKQARLMHFGYPPLMRSMYIEGGRELTGLMKRGKGLGLTTSLDLALPDPGSEAGQVDWRGVLEGVLPWVDVFTPSLEELLFMLDLPRWQQLMNKGRIDLARDVTLTMLDELAMKLIGMGTAVVMIKLGDQGAYVKVSDDAGRLQKMGRAQPVDVKGWAGVRAMSACFAAKLVGTTGSGDCTIAGFLTGLLKGLLPGEALELATAVGACSVEQADATSGVPRLDRVVERMQKGWKRLPSGVK